MALCMRCQLQDLGGIHLLIAPVVHRGHFEIALRDSSCFVHDDIFDIRQRLHEIGALDQDTLAACASDPAEKRERNTDHDRTRTADDKEGERPVDPIGPQRPI